MEADATPRPVELTRVVALDGPAGSGKSTVARAVARQLGWRFVDTGATYRAITLAVLRAEADLSDADAVLDVARSVRIELSTDPDEAFVRLDGEDVTAEVRSDEVTSQVSAVSALPPVRELLIELQRRAMGTAGAVVEGRDIATVVAPQAAVKVYLDASPEVRAQRRAAELDQVPASPGQAAERIAAVAQSIAVRDRKDNQTTQLASSDGAVHLETSDLSIDQVVAEIVQMVAAAGLR